MLAARRRTEPHTIRVGHINPASRLLEDLSFPLQDHMEAIGWMRQALRDAAAHRIGVSVIGAKGAGKSLALEDAIRRFDSLEEQRWEADRINYRRRRVLRVSVLATDSESEFIRHLAAKQWGRIPPAFSRLKDSGLFEKLLMRWIARGVVVVCFDEAEQLSSAGLKVIRDILAKSHDLMPRTTVVTDDGGNERIGFMAPGIGALMVGTQEFARRLERHYEYGQRFQKPYEVAGVPLDQLPDVYAGYLPCWRKAADEMGEEEWGTFIHHLVAPVVGGNLRRIENHARRYVTRCVDELRPPPPSLESVPYDETWFLESLAELPELDGEEALGT